MWRKRRILAGEVENEDQAEETTALINVNDEPNSDMNQFSAFMNSLAQTNSISLSAQPAANKKSRSTIEAELSNFDSLPRLAVDTQVMDFWKNQKAFPVLKGIALDIISVPVTEVSVERLFSHLNFILNPHRSNMNQGLLEDVLFLRMNNAFGP